MSIISKLRRVFADGQPQTPAPQAGEPGGYGQSDADPRRAGSYSNSKPLEIAAGSGASDRLSVTVVDTRNQQPKGFSGLPKSSRDMAYGVQSEPSRGDVAPAADGMPSRTAASQVPGSTTASIESGTGRRLRGGK